MLSSISFSYGLPKLARIVSYGISACEPSIMGIGPVEAVRIALARSGLKKDDIDIWDVNEVCDVVMMNNIHSHNIMSRPLPRNG